MELAGERERVGILCDCSNIRDEFHYLFKYPFSRS